MEVLQHVAQLCISVCNADTRNVTQPLQHFKYEVCLFSVLLSPTDLFVSTT
jgi:hypothetical protein